MLEEILQGLVEWVYDLLLKLVAYCGDALLKLMGTSLDYFKQNVPAFIPMLDILVSVGWALLLGNLVFQAMRGMLAGLGFEAEDPVELFGRTFVFSFLLLFSRDICELGLSLTQKVIDLFSIPDSINFKPPAADAFTNAGDIGWLVAIIIGVILSWQVIKFFFEIAERYVIVVILSLLAPVGFAMGGSKSTKDIATGYIRMFASMCFMLVMNVVFLILIFNCLSTVPSGLMIFPWCLLITGIVRVARKVDSIATKIGLNPAITGDGLGHGGPAMLMMMAVRAPRITAQCSKAPPAPIPRTGEPRNLRKEVLTRTIHRTGRLVRLKAAPPTRSRINRPGILKIKARLAGTGARDKPQGKMPQKAMFPLRDERPSIPTVSASARQAEHLPHQSRMAAEFRAKFRPEPRPSAKPGCGRARLLLIPMRKTAALARMGHRRKAPRGIRT